MKIELHLNQESNRLSLENNHLNNLMTGSNARVVELTEQAADAALRTQRLAEYASRATRVNVQLLMVR